MKLEFLTTTPSIAHTGVLLLFIKFEESIVMFPPLTEVPLLPVKIEETILAFLDCIKTSAELFANVESLTFTVPLEYTT